VIVCLKLFLRAVNDSESEYFKYQGRYVFFLGGRAGASEGRVITESEHQTGRAIPHVSYSREGHTSFPDFFTENFWDVAFYFSYR